MHLHILSDLHVEFRPFDPTPPTRDAVVVLAGDTHLGLRGVEWARRSFQDMEVLYLLGNHEFYGQAAPDLIGKAQTLGASLGVHVLADSTVVIQGVRFLGATLWTDFNLRGNAEIASFAAREHMTDFRRIRVTPGYRKLRPSDTVIWFRRSVRFLERALAEPFAGRTVVVTHHAPSALSLNPSFAPNDLSAAYASNLDELVARSGVALWIHGHTHHNTAYRLGRTQVISNQRGYPDEPAAGFDPTLLALVA